jgi:precorrin-6A/cobalt-precorrin-6A reductase
MAVLLLSGTTEGRLLADHCHAQGIAVVSALAGATAQAAPRAGLCLRAPFHTADDLARCIHTHHIRCIVDCTHPYATAITSLAYHSCRALHMPYMRLQRPSILAGIPHRVFATLPDMAAELPGNARVFLSIGRKGVPAFAACRDQFFIRAVDRPAQCPARSTLMLARGPFAYPAELALFETHRFTHLISKDSGAPLRFSHSEETTANAASIAKIQAAHQMRCAIWILQRPNLPRHCPSTHTLADAMAWITAHITT